MLRLHHLLLWVQLLGRHGVAEAPGFLLEFGSLPLEFRHSLPPRLLGGLSFGAHAVVLRREEGGLRGQRAKGGGGGWEELPRAAAAIPSLANRPCTSAVRASTFLEERREGGKEGRKRKILILVKKTIKSAHSTTEKRWTVARSCNHFMSSFVRRLISNYESLFAENAIAASGRDLSRFEFQISPSSWAWRSFRSAWLLVSCSLRSKICSFWPRAFRSRSSICGEGKETQRTLGDL